MSDLRPTNDAGVPLSLLSVHAHPDDEASKGSATVAKYAAEGIRGVLVCCTGGEEGEILNPAVDTPEVRENLHEVRMQELQDSVDTIGYEQLYMLGYRDSGMKDTEANARPENFANAPLDEAVERLVRIIRAERPQVIITYGDDSKFYPHPDHVRVHEISGPAFEAAGDPNAFQDSGAPWQPQKMYYTGWSAKRIRALHDTFIARGEESPYATWFERDGFDEREADEHFTTYIEVGDFLHKRREALLAHRTQVDPTGFWMRLPDDVLREVFPWEEFALARSLVDNGVPEGDSEDDLFAGLRAPART
jgi:mycothiol S-conjugate amidase